jgi:acyl-[acyl-carrier-protein]-phospholipid O-acyltransferase/long-chain-fatty-acid--[acyl-carrier-protein] ligase
MSTPSVTSQFPDTPLIDSGYDSMMRRSELKKPLGWHCLKSLKRRPLRTVVVDLTNGRRVLKAWMIIALSRMLAKHWSTNIQDKRVGIVLPPGPGAILANLSLVWAGKIPVNLNFTSSRESLLSAMRQSDIRSLITAEAMKEKLPDFPWPEGSIDLVKILRSFPKWKILAAGIISSLLPTGLLWRGLRGPSDTEEEAALLFSSGSSGEPKGIVLSHRNIVGNCIQIKDTNVLSGQHTLLACLPVFHSFGFTVTLWFPLMYPVRVVTLPSPLEVARIARAVEEEQVTVLLGTPTFLRPYLKKATREQLSSVKFVIAGAEKVPEDLFRDFHEVLGKQILEGYGMTETSPVIAVNLPECSPFMEDKGAGRCYREGSVGQLLPGMQAAVLHPETGDPLGLDETGMLYLRGPNVFSRYQGEAGSDPDNVRNGWIRTGDLARIDKEGFLHIEGRLSRFSKIGGEMVPHGAIEEWLTETMGLREAEEHVLVVMSKKHPTKGEVLVILSAVDISLDEVRNLMQGAGFPNLWIPREWVKIDKIPVLPAGKLNLPACQRAIQ